MAGLGKGRIPHGRTGGMQPRRAVSTARTGSQWTRPSTTPVSVRGIIVRPAASPTAWGQRWRASLYGEPGWLRTGPMTARRGAKADIPWDRSPSARRPAAGTGAAASCPSLWRGCRSPGNSRSFLARIRQHGRRGQVLSVGGAARVSYLRRRDGSRHCGGPHSRPGSRDIRRSGRLSLRSWFRAPQDCPARDRRD